MKERFPTECENDRKAREIVERAKMEMASVKIPKAPIASASNAELRAIEEFGGCSGAVYDEMGWK